MPKGYWQCPACKQKISTRFKYGDEKVEIFCHCSNPPVKATFCAEGLEGRNNWPHGKPNHKQP